MAENTTNNEATTAADENCTHNCSTCSSNCSSRTAEPSFAMVPDGCSVKNVYAVISGKGGVGKSMVSTLLAVASQRAGKKTAIMDADITGPSIPNAFGLHGQADCDGEYLYPMESDNGIKTISVNLLLENETTPVVWRGPVVSGTVKQFWTEVFWGDVDTMFIDCPPGTSDVALTLFQSIPIDGIIIVTTPQDLVSMIVAKAVNMAKMMNIPILGIVENMSGFKCPDCGKMHAIFGESHIEELAATYDIPAIAKLPIDPSVGALSDAGRIEEVDDETIQKLEAIIEKL